VLAGILSLLKWNFFAHGYAAVDWLCKMLDSYVVVAARLKKGMIER
jgi:hypothetical protein